MIPVDQRKADMSDPEQHFGWAVASIPAAGYDQTRPSVVLPMVFVPWFSRFLWDCGFRHHPELQVNRQRVDASAPLRNAGVVWERVPEGESPGDVDEPVGVDLAAMSEEDAKALLQALQERLGL